ncbi:hypothetical protein EUA98_19185 [Pengzhenrongella frigida]|uniref:Uncharacterized protein n=1 Tax=Pengzhenrongella frigida TaxID=1259133 RepID=A0A4Q5MV55_9MICO|nr:hypothetical protein EUA98_19185 [Cellulomonas sp. HLT2-17]
MGDYPRCRGRSRSAPRCLSPRSPRRGDPPRSRRCLVQRFGARRRRLLPRLPRGRRDRDRSGPHGIRDGSLPLTT